MRERERERERENSSILLWNNRASKDSLRSLDRIVPLPLNCQKSHDIQATNKENLAGKADLIPILYNCIVIRVPIPEESERERERERRERSACEYRVSDLGWIIRNIRIVLQKAAAAAAAAAGDRWIRSGLGEESRGDLSATRLCSQAEQARPEASKFTYNFTANFSIFIPIIYRSLRAIATVYKALQRCTAPSRRVASPRLTSHHVSQTPRIVTPTPKVLPCISIQVHTYSIRIPRNDLTLLAASSLHRRCQTFSLRCLLLV